MAGQQKHEMQERKSIYLANHTAVQAQLETLMVLMQQHEEKATDHQYPWEYIIDLEALRDTLNTILVPDAA